MLAGMFLTVTTSVFTSHLLSECSPGGARRPGGRVIRGYFPVSPGSGCNWLTSINSQSLVFLDSGEELGVCRMGGGAQVQI